MSALSDYDRGALEDFPEFPVEEILPEEEAPVEEKVDIDRKSVV